MPPDTNVTMPPDMNITIAPTDGNETNITTVAPTASPSVPNTDQSVYFTWEYGFANGTGREPTQAEIEDLMCQTNLYIRDRVRNATQNETVQSVGMHINWMLLDAAMQPISLQFLSNTTYENGQAVPPQTVIDALELETEDFLMYLENYVWNVAIPDSVFKNATSASLNEAAAGNPVPPGMLEAATCPETEAPSMAPSVSPAPSVSASPSLAPSTSSAPTSSMSPSWAPSLSQAPTIATTSAPTVPAPVVAPTEAPIPGGPATRQQINAKFLVSNLEMITAIATVNNSGLQQGWPSFVADVVTNTIASRTFTTGPSGGGRRQLRETDTHRRRLTVDLEPGTEVIYDIVLVPCPTNMGPVHPDLTCHDAFGTYTLLLRGDEDAALVEQEFGMATVMAINDGQLVATIKQITPGTPLYIGTVAPPADCTRRKLPLPQACR